MEEEEDPFRKMQASAFLIFIPLLSPDETFHLPLEPFRLLIQFHLDEKWRVSGIDLEFCPFKLEA